MLHRFFVKARFFARTCSVDNRVDARHERSLQIERPGFLTVAKIAISDDHFVVGLQAFADDTQAFVERAERDLPHLDDVLVVDHEHDLTRLVGRDGRLGGP